MTNRNLTPAASSAKDPLLQTNQKKPTVRSFYAHAHCVFRSDVRLDVRFSLGRTFKRTFYLDKYVSIFDTDGLPYELVNGGDSELADTCITANSNYRIVASDLGCST